ncbi:hypothetical protein ABZP36_002673 [Zizania latifolia]
MYAPGGFLFEWWSIFWDIFIARTNEKHLDVAALYIEVCIYAFIYLFMVTFICETRLLTYLFCVLTCYVTGHDDVLFLSIKSCYPWFFCIVGMPERFFFCV